MANHQDSLRVLSPSKASQSPQSLDDYLFLGQSCYRAGDHSNAKTWLLDYLSQSQDCSPERRAEAFDGLGQCHAALRDNVQAKRCYKIATQLYPAFATAWYHLGEICVTLAQQELKSVDSRLKSLNLLFRKIKPAFLELSSLNAEEVFANAALWCFEFLKLLQRLERLQFDNIDNTYKAAFQYHHQAINACDSQKQALRHRIKSDLIEALAEYGHYLYRQGWYLKAQKYYSQTLKLDPDHLSALNQMGMCLCKEGAYPQARDFFEEILGRTQDPKEQAHAWLNIACSFRLQNNWLKAAKTLREAQRLDPRDPDVMNEERQLKRLVAANALSRGSEEVSSRPQRSKLREEEPRESSGWSFLSP